MLTQQLPRNFSQLYDFAVFADSNLQDENHRGQFFAYSVLRGCAYTALRERVSRKNIQHVEIVDVLQRGFGQNSHLFPADSVEANIDAMKSLSREDLGKIRFVFPLNHASTVHKGSSLLIPLFAQYLQSDPSYNHKLLKYGKALYLQTKARGLVTTQGVANRRDYAATVTVLEDMLK